MKGVFILAAAIILTPIILLAAAPESSVQSLRGLSPEQICRGALNPSQTAWDQSASEYVAEAASRGLTVDTCRQLLAPTPTSGRASTDSDFRGLVVMIFFPLLAVGLGLAWLLITKPIEAKAGSPGTPMPKFIITRDGKPVAVEAPDEAAAHAMSDYKTENAVTTSTDRESAATISGWWYVSNNARKGPISDENLRQLLIDGTLNSNSLIWKQGMKGWQPARQIDELTPLLSSLPPEIPIRPPEVKIGEVPLKPRMKRKSRAFLGATIGAALALFGAWFNSWFAGADFSPEWIAYGLGFFAPWLLIGGAIGFFSGRKTQRR